jgi:error-prone DNA polymerase
MYPRRLLLEDAREHGIPILPLDVNRSEPEYVVEEVGEPPRYGIRLALQDVHGISDAEIRQVLRVRAELAFRGVGDFLRRTTVSRPVVEALAHAGAFDALPSGTRRDRLYAAMTTAPQREGDQLAFDLSAPAASAGSLPEYTDAERVRAELEVLGLDASRHLLSFFEPLLADLDVTRSGELRRRRADARVMVAGVKVASQTPAIRSGQRIIDLTLDDATGPVEVVVFESVQPKVARTVFGSFLLAVLGTVRRTGVKGVSVVAEDVWDLTSLHRARRQGRLAQALAHEARAGAGGPKLHSSPDRGRGGR